MMKNQKLIIFRHGETSWNAEGRLQGHLEIPLNAKGKKQAEELALQLKEKNIKRILSSDLERAKETGIIVSTTLNVPIEFEIGLREIHLGEAQGILISEVNQKYGDQFWERWQSQNPMYDHLFFPGGESKKDVDRRIQSALVQKIDFFREKTAALCTHGYVMTRIARMYRADLIKNDILHIQNGEYIEIELERIINFDSNSKI
ncbi:phosphoglycerate kinase [Leptospira tipperaryensis]|uniref:Phosphoglycerate kinase n=1 Tax=Leptospira tipperaryensis TaxID=2564040 RepID=A0A1D7V3Y9_9LEPT|nr:histidine phosphatase family protein [Leptospira tipperaryensis]AOP36542.1 phosphoglycerate kinase [Leptospira tipperaryensis]